MNTAAILVLMTSFNLICTGNDTSGIIENGRMLHSKFVPFTNVLRIDLQKMRWCERDCPATFPIHAVTEETIQITDDPTEGSSKQFYISRENGRMLRRDQDGTFVDVQIGECKRALFTGFPKRKF